MAKLEHQKTLKLLAQNTGVSQCTASRVMNGKARQYRISVKTEKLVLAEAKRLQYVPNQNARALRLQKTNTLGLILPDIGNPFFGGLARDIELEATKRGYSVFIYNSNGSTDIEADSVRLLNSREVEGIIIAPASQTCSHLQELYDNGLPLVMVDRYFDNMNFPYVTSDNYSGSFEATEYLIENGHINIACIQGPPECLVNIQRIKGYTDALEKHNIPLDSTLIVGNQFDEHSGYVGAKQLLERVSRPTAIFTLSAPEALGTVSAITEEGLSIPDDISIITFDDQSYFQFFATPLTAIAHQEEKMGEIAVHAMIDQIESKASYKPKNTVLSTHLNIRKSVKKL